MRVCIGGHEEYCSFVVTEENKEAIDKVMEFASEEGNSLLCVWGEQGTGKTHLSRIARDVLAEEGCRVKILEEYDLMGSVIRWRDQHKDENEFYRCYEMWDGVILENIHRYGEEYFQEACNILIHQFWLRGKKVMITCEGDPQELVWLESERLFEKVELSNPSSQLKEMVLQDYEQIAKVTLSEPVRNVILERTSKIPEIRNALSLALLHHKGQGKDLTEDLMKSILRRGKNHGKED